MKSRVFIIVCIFCFCYLENCTVKQVKTSPEFKTSLSGFKRLTVAVDPKSNVGNSESAMAKVMAEQELAHHKEFIVYPDPTNRNVKCDAKIGKAQGVLRLKIEETPSGTTPFILFWFAPAIFGPTKDGIKLNIIAEIQKCDIKENLWEGEASSSYSLSGEEDQSLRTVYETKFGKTTGSKAVPYYHILKSLLDEIESPVLTEAEQDEKIEIESGG